MEESRKGETYGFEKIQPEEISKGWRRVGRFGRRCDPDLKWSDINIGSVPRKRILKELIAYGERSHFVTSMRMAVAERPSPDMFGLTFHVLSPLQDSVGIITPSSLHFIGTHRGAIVPDIDPREYRLLIHGMVDRPLEFTMEELKRFPSVSRIHFIECLGNRSKAEIRPFRKRTG